MAGPFRVPLHQRQGSQGGLERLVFYSDAVCAIAITLLVLPLTDALNDVVRTATDHHLGFLQVIVREPYVSMLVASVISFYAIARLWYSHHEVFEGVEHYTPALVVVNLVWLLTIVLLPLPTQFLAVASFTESTFVAYIGLITLSGLLLTLMATIILRTPNLVNHEDAAPRRRLAATAINAGAYLVALLLGVLIPQIGYYAMIAVTVSTPIQLVLRRGRQRTDSASSSRSATS